MAPPWVLLDRRVSFVRSGPAVIDGSWDYDDLLAARDADMKNMKPNLHIADPPEVSRLSMVRQMDVKNVRCGIISCTDKALVLLFAGLPGLHKGYLVYDASSKSISWIPSLPGSLNCMLRAAILSLGKGSYLLAELVRGPELGLVTLYQWRSTSNTRRGRWIRSAARPPPHLFMTHSFHIDMVFSYGSSSVCWVDLLRGVLICDLLKSPEPEFTFVPLPLGYCIDVPSEPRQGRPRPKEFRTMGCVGGVIKFVTVVGYYGNHSHDDMLLKTWTLSPDHKEWELCNTLAVPHLWASDSFRERNLPQIRPSFPIISPDDAEIVNVTLSDIEYEKKVDFFGVVHRGRMLLKAQYLVSINTVKNKVLSSCKLTHEYPRPKFLDLTASDLSAYVQDSNDVCKGQAWNKQEEEQSTSGAYLTQEQLGRGSIEGLTLDRGTRKRKY
ncbi:Unknown protein [Striga hermonthica]|uniref:DUF1618 domain-containing protein n=1 Tax=Striga hermonthica TaxID=68872 RepID=A0A9N7N962_STRHE|nr:Unknown protein [Striga hermonthica]